MARIRYLKPQAAEDVKLAECSRDARLLYRDLWCHMDRQGLTEDEPKLIKRNIFPYDDDLTAERVKILIDELARVGRLIRLDWHGKRLLYCPTFGLHQKFHRGEEPRFNIPQENLDALLAPCKHPASTIPAPFNDPANSIGIGIGIGIGNGQQERATGIVNGATAPAPVPTEAFQECVRTWHETLDHFRCGRPKRTLIPGEDLLIGRAIQRWGYKPVELALYGARFEPKDERFDPSKFVRLKRYLDPENFDRFVNLGVGAKHKEGAA